MIRVLLLTEESVFDLGTSAGKCWPVIAVFQLKHIRLKYSFIFIYLFIFCVWIGLLRLFYVVSCVVRAVDEFDFRIVINRKLDKWRPVESHAVFENRVFDRICVWYPTIIIMSVKGLYPRCMSTSCSWVMGITNVVTSFCFFQFNTSDSSLLIILVVMLSFFSVSVHLQLS